MQDFPEDAPIQIPQCQGLACFGVPVRYIPEPAPRFFPMTVGALVAFSFSCAAACRAFAMKSPSSSVSATRTPASDLISRSWTILYNAFQPPTMLKNPVAMTGCTAYGMASCRCAPVPLSSAFLRGCTAGARADACWPALTSGPLSIMPAEACGSCAFSLPFEIG